MMNTKSDYALNKKDTKAIIYLDAEGRLTRLSKESFSCEEEFLYWKSWSDANYHAIENENHLFANHTVPLDLLAEGISAIPSAAAFVEAVQEQAEKQRFNVQILAQLRAILTETQFRRLCLIRISGLTVRDIALREAVSFQCVHKSIQSAEKKIFKFLQKQGDKKL